MHITLIRPNIGRLDHSLFADEARMEPLALGAIAALTPDDIDVSVVDDRIEDIPYDEKTDLVGISVETYTARRAYEIADEYRSRGVRVMLGGIHVSLIPEEAALHADSIYIGDAVFLWGEVITDLRSGAVKPLYRACSGAPHGLVRRDLFPRDYLPLSLIEFTRGCRHGCEYCAVSAVNGGKEFCRSVEETIAEVQRVNKRYLFFVDDNIISDTDQAKRLFRALIPLRIRWVSQATISMTDDDELMRLMTESGCLGNVIGFESITEASINGMGKSVNSRALADNYRTAISKLRAYGLQTWAAFTIGHDDDTRDGIARTLDFAVHNRFTFAAFNILMPYPGTPLYARFAAEGRLLYDGKWWLHPEYRFNYAAFKPRQMSADELTAAGLDVRKRFNSLPSIMYRALDMRTNMRSLLRLGLYLAYNPLFRKETFKKHGMRFGLR